MIIYKIAELFEKIAEVDKEIVLHEHDTPEVSYMVFNNLKSIISDANDILHLLNKKDDLPAWADEKLSIAKDNVSKLLDYIKSEKTVLANLENKLIKLAKGKYDHIDFKPPKSVADAAARGLELRKQNKGKGGLSAGEAHKQGIGSGVVRAVSLKNRQTLNPSTVKRMKAFFDRHEKNKAINKGLKPSEDKGYISHMLWGGDAGKSWANKICKQMEAADKK